jgi:putative addiction module CopG family antidote
MTSLNISLPKALKAYVEGQVASGDWGTPSEFVRELIRKDKERRLSVREEQRTATPKRRRKRTRRVRERVKSGLSVMEEMIAERRAAARKE